MKLKTITPRYQVENHTNHLSYCHRVVDRWTGETYGYGLLAPHAIALAIELEEASK